MNVNSYFCLDAPLKGFDNFAWCPATQKKTVLRQKLLTVPSKGQFEACKRIYLQYFLAIKRYLHQTYLEQFKKELLRFVGKKLQ